MLSVEEIERLKELHAAAFKRGTLGLGAAAEFVDALPLLLAEVERGRAAQGDNSAGAAAPPLPPAAEANLRQALQAAYTHITQPRRMTQTEATYDIQNYNALTTRIRVALGMEKAR